MAIARALALGPRLLILDEALSNLDAANQALILKLLEELQAAHSLSFLHISHDLRLVSEFADEVAVMYQGRVVDRQSTRESICFTRAFLHQGTSRQRALRGIDPARAVGIGAAMRYLARRLVHSVLLLFGVSVFSFGILQLAPGDFFTPIRLNPQVSAHTVAALRSQYGLDKPFPIRYEHWLHSAFRGDFGISFAYGTPVAPLLAVRARNTLLLTGTALLVAWLLAIPFGIWSAARRGKWGDRAGGIVTSSLLTVPDLVLFLALLLVAVRTGWFPTGGMMSAGFEDLSMRRQD